MVHESKAAFTIRRIADLDAAARLYEEEIQPMLMRAVNEVMGEWADKKDWDAHISDYGIPRAFPAGWQNKKNNEEDPIAWFEMNVVGSRSLWVAELCGVGTGAMVMWWDWLKQDYGYHNHPRWIKFLADYAAFYVDELRQAHFTYHEGTGLFFTPVQMVPSRDLAQWMESGDPEEVLRLPITVALDRCDKAKPLFDKILAAAKAHANKSGWLSGVAEAAEPDRHAPVERTLALLAGDPRRRSGAPADQAPIGIGRVASGVVRPRRRVLYDVLAGAAAILLIGVWGSKTGLHPSINSPAARSEEASAALAVAPVSDVHPVEALAQERKRAEALAEIAALKPQAAAQQSLTQERQRAQILEKLVQEFKKSEALIRGKTEALARDLDAARAEIAVLKSRAQSAD
jgi:hypothetical protein